MFLLMLSFRSKTCMVLSFLSNKFKQVELRPLERLVSVFLFDKILTVLYCLQAKTIKWADLVFVT